MATSKFTFIALSKSFDLEVSGSDDHETMVNTYWVMAPFVTSIDSSTDRASVNSFQQNTAEIRKKIKDLVDQIKHLNPRINRLSDYFEKELDDDEWFFIAINQDFVPEQVDRIMTELMSIGASPEDKERNEKMNEILQAIRSVYNISIFYEQTKGFIGEPDKQKRVCRYCHRSMPDVTFRKVAHTISEALGNKSIKTNDECDECNQYFGDTIEQDFLSIFDVPRLMFRIKGKAGVPHKFIGDNYSIEREDDGNIKVSYMMKDGEQPMEADEFLKRIMLTPHRSFPEQNIYKCLCKYVMGVLDDETLIAFDRTRRWINGEITENKLPKVARFYHPEIAEHPRLMVYIRKAEASKEFPHVVAELRIFNLAFVYILPFSSQEEVDFSEEINFEHYWAFFEIYSKIEGWQMSDCSSMDVKHPTIALSFKQRENPQTGKPE